MKILKTESTSLYCTAMHDFSSGENYINSCVIDRKTGLHTGFIKGYSTLKNFLGELLDQGDITYKEYSVMLKLARETNKGAKGFLQIP